MVNKNLKSFPVLTTERLTLRQPAMDDRDAVFALRSDAEINRYLDREPSKTPEEAMNFINKVNENMANHSAMYWVISLTNTQTFVGTIVK